MISYLFIGLGVYIALITTDTSALFEHPKWELFVGFILTVILWPVAIFNNWNKHA